MPKYHYSGRQLDGEAVEGTISARHESELEEKLVSRGIVLERFQPTLPKLQQLVVRYFRRAEITKITRQINLLLASEIPVLEALRLGTEQINDKTLNAIYDNAITQVEAGSSLATAFGQYPIVFDQLYVSMVDAGEMSGRLDLAFDRIATYRERYETTTKKLRSALAYPALVVLVAALVMIALILYVVPIFSSMYNNFGAELPALTRRVIAVSDFLKNTIWYWLGAVILAGLSIILMGMSSKFMLLAHKLIVKSPLINRLAVKIVTARFCRTMGALLTSGVDIIYALRIASNVTGNNYVGQLLQPVELLLVQGQSFTNAIESTNLFPRAMLRLTASGEKTGRLGEMLTRAADFYERETETDITTLTTLVEPVIIILLGILVAFILVAMYMPLFDLVGTI